MISVEKSPRITLAVLFVVGALNLFDRQIVNILSQSIKLDLALSDARLGLLTGTAFGLLYSGLGIPLGLLGDRVDRIKLIAAALILWSGFTALCGASGNFLQLFLARMGVGVGEAGSQPASTALISDVFGAKHRTSAMSLLLIGAPAGSLLGLLVGGYVGAHWGWRGAFVIAGVPGALVAILMLVMLKDPRHLKEHSTNSSFLSTIRALARPPRFRWLTVGLVCSSFFPYAGAAWLPPFFIRVYGMSTAETGVYSALALGAGGALGTLGAGVLCDRLRGRIADIELKVLIANTTLGVLALIATVLSPVRSVALGAMMLFGVSAYAFLGPSVNLIQGEVAPRRRSVGVAVCIAVSNILNLGLALPLIGRLSDALAPARGPRAVGIALALGGVAVASIGVLAQVRAMHVSTGNSWDGNAD